MCTVNPPRPFELLQLGPVGMLPPQPMRAAIAERVESVKKMREDTARALGM
jgi:hypothetical protein